MVRISNCNNVMIRLLHCGGMLAPSALYYSYSGV